MTTGSVAINSNGELSASELNNYLGASLTNQLHFVGTYGTPNFSLNQIFYSTVGSDPPSAPNAFDLSSLRGKRFAIYTTSDRTLYHTGSWIQEAPNRDRPDLGEFTGYFGFGQSGILNPTNKNFPLAVNVKTTGDIIIQTKTGEGITWTNKAFDPIAGETTFFTTAADAIRIFSLGRGGRLQPGEIDRTTVYLYVAPCLSQTLPSSGEVSDLRGAHSMTLTFQNSGLDDGPGPGVPGEINDGLNNGSLDNPLGPIP